jgi:hypothetical protein
LAADAVADFATAWGDSEKAALPQLVLDAAQLDAATTLAVRPRTVESTFRELLSLTARTQRLGVVYQAEVMPAGADRFHWLLTVPPDLAIQSVSAEVAEKPISLDWVRVAPDRLNVFFAQAVTNPYRLRLVGSTKVSKFGPQPLPRITAVDQPPAAQTVALYREADVLADWKF